MSLHPRKRLQTEDEGVNRLPCDRRKASQPLPMPNPGQLTRLPVSADSGDSWSMAALAWQSPRFVFRHSFSPAASGVVPIRWARPGGVGALCFWGNAVVEHKAQTHNGCFALVSRFCCAVYSDAPVYFKRGLFASRLKGACEDGNKLTKAQKA